MKKHTIIVLLLICLLNASGQVVSFEDIPFATIDEISLANDSLVDMTQYPIVYSEDNGLKIRVMQSIIPDFQEKSIFKSIAEDYIEKKGISDNGKKGEHYAITSYGNSLKLKKFKTIKRYLYGEGSGVLYYTSIDEFPGFNEEDIFCIFNDNIEYKESLINLYEIDFQTNNRNITPNKIINYESENSKLRFKYSADFCSGHFQVDGMGTISPTYYNLKLEVANLETGKKQTILKIPYEWRYRLRGLKLGDINSDGFDDIIITLEDDCCIERLMFMSNKDSKKSLYRYVGSMTVYCDYP